MLSRPTPGRSVERRLTDDRSIRRPYRIATDTRPTPGRYIDRYVDRQSTEVSTATSVDILYKTQDPKFSTCAVLLVSALIVCSLFLIRVSVFTICFCLIFIKCGSGCFQALVLRSSTLIDRSGALVDPHALTSKSELE